MAVSEWKHPSRREEEAVRKYFEEELNFMAAENYYVKDHELQIRRYAVQLVTKFSRGNTDDAFVAYLAMNYFDRYVSRHGLPTNQGTQEDKIQWLVVCCITIASKMRRKSFTVDSFLADKHLEISLQRIMEGELLILNALEWRMRPITPICFLDHYYPKFITLGGFSRRCINEIIVQSQGELSFTRVRPSEIALSSLMAAATILYPDQASSVNDTLSDPPCLYDMINLCHNKNIQILRPGGASAKQSEESDAANSRGKGKAPVTEIVPAYEDIPKKQMNFPIRWVANMDEEVNIPPPLEGQGGSQSQDPASTSEVNSDGNTGGATFCGCPCNCNCNLLEGLSGCCNIL